MKTTQFERDLGKKITEIKPNIVFFYILLGGGLLLSLCGLSTFFVNLGEAVNEGRFADLIVGFVMLALGLLGLWIGYNRSRRHVYRLTAYENGLVSEEKGERQTILWHNVAQVNKRTVVNTRGQKRRHYWTVVDTNHQKIAIGPWTEIGELAEKSVLPRLWQQLQVMLEEGKRVNFGPVSIDRTGMYHKDQQILWQDINGVGFNGLDGSVNLNTGQGNVRWRCGSVPNIPLLRQAIDMLKPDTAG